MAEEGGTLRLREKINVLQNELSALHSQLYQWELMAEDGAAKLPADKGVAERLKSEASNARAQVLYHKHKIALREAKLKPLQDELETLEKESQDATG